MDAGTILGIIGIALAMVGIAVGVPPFIQMWYGRPDLSFDVSDFTGPAGKSLFITFRNKTTQSRFLRWLRVVREVGDVTTSFNVQQQGTNLFIAKDVSGSLHNAVLRESGLMARAFPGRTVGLTVIHFQGGAAHIVDARADTLKTIPAGDYVVHAVFFCGEKIYHFKKDLKINAEQHRTHWY